MAKRTSAEEEWKEKYNTLSADHAALQASTDSVTALRDTLQSEKSSLESQLAASEGSLIELKVQLSKLSSDHGTATRQLSLLQTDLVTAQRRADRSDEAHRSLQSENVELMESLNEMRGRIVELNQDKVELEEKIENIQRELKYRDGAVGGLEANLQQSSARCEELEHELRGLEEHLGKEKFQWERMDSEREKALVEVEAKLKESEAIVTQLAAERNTHHLAMTRSQAELQRCQEEVDRRASELQATKREREETDRLVRALEEVQAMRSEGVAKDEEIQRLREDLEASALGPLRASSPAVHGSKSSLNDEMFESVKQQNALEHSQAQSRIRTLETEVYQEQAKTHTLQRRIQSLEEDLSKLRTDLQRQQSTSPRSHAYPTRPSPLRQNSERKSAEYRRLALGVSPIAPRRPLEDTTPSSLTLDSVLSPEARHKRKISLSMLKARIESETAARRVPLGTAPNGMKALGSTAEEHRRVGSERHGAPRPQFGDETHVFCCASCSGELVVL